MKYGIYNDELGYGLGPEFTNPFDAILASNSKCRRHHVVVFDDNGAFVRNMTLEEETAIYEAESKNFPASRIYYIFKAKTPLAVPENELENWSHINPFKELAIRSGLKFGGVDSLIGCAYMDIPEYVDGGGFGIGVEIDYAMAPELREKFDRLARKMECPAVIKYNKYSVRMSTESYKK